MYLKNEITVTEPYKGTSKFAFWNSLKEGDVLEVGMKLEPTGSNRGKIYAPLIKIRNVRAKETFVDTINSVQNYLKKIKYV